MNGANQYTHTSINIHTHAHTCIDTHAHTHTHRDKFLIREVATEVKNDCIKVGSCVSHFNVSLINCVGRQESVHKAQFWKRKESQSRSNQGPSANQPSALSLGHTGSQQYMPGEYVDEPADEA